MRLDEVVDKIFMGAYNEARFRNHEYFTPEHILFSSLHFDEGIEIVENCGGDIVELKSDLEEFFFGNIPVIENGEPVATIGVNNVMQIAAAHVNASGKNIILVGDIYAAILEEKDSFAAYFMKKNGVTRINVLNFISHGVSILGSKEDNDNDNNDSEAYEGYEDCEDYEGIGNDANYEDGEDIEDIEDSDATEEKIHDNSKENSKKDFLANFTVDLTEKAIRGEIDPLIGREDILQRTIQVLSRRQKNNPIHVGDPGVGKTAITEGLAMKIIGNNVPKALQGCRILYLDMGSMLAGTKYRGDFEQRMKKVLNKIEKMGKAIVFIDEVHNIVGAGAVSGGSMDASNILKPFLMSGKLRFIGSTTYEEYKKYFEKDRALSRRFQKIEVNEPSVEDTYKILQGLKEKYEEFHNVKYSDEALAEAAHLSAKYINDRHLPDKAIDVIDEAGAYARLKAGDESLLEITKKDIERVVSLIAKIPEQSVSNNETLKLKELDSIIKKEIFGQDKAVDTVTRAIKRSRAGFNEGEKPVASLLFVGPTGVGKTELSRQLSVTLGVPLLRYDMSEYQEKHTVARLIGAPPGYVGYEEGGLLTDAIRKTPYCVLLLDEIEKAHADIFNVLLQVMDYATLTDNNGKKADFRNVVLIMTSNAGASEIGRSMIGFEKRIIDQSAISKEVERIFSPEFRNRLDEVVVFQHLNKDMALLISRKAIRKFEEKLASKNITLKVTDNCYAWLADKGVSSVYGAREILRVVQDKIKTYFVDEVLFGGLSDGGTAVIDVRDGDIFISIYCKKE